MRLNQNSWLATVIAILLTAGVAGQSPASHSSCAGCTVSKAGTANVAVAPQYDTTHVYVDPVRILTGSLPA